MMAPISDSCVNVRRWPVCSGVSRTIRTTRRRSFSATSAARDINVDVTPQAISDAVRMEQGATIMPFVWKEPEEMAAPRSALECTTSASALTSASASTAAPPPDQDAVTRRGRQRAHHGDGRRDDQGTRTRDHEQRHATQHPLDAIRAVDEEGREQGHHHG